LADGLKRLKAGGPARDVDADTRGRAVVDGHKHRDLPLTRDGCGQIGAPHRIHRLGDDGALVRAWSAWRTDPCGREQSVLAHEPQHPAFGRA